MRKLLMLLVIPLAAIAMMLAGCSNDCNTCPSSKYMSSDSTLHYESSSGSSASTSVD